VLGQAKLALSFQIPSQASLPMGYQKLRSIRFANDPCFFTRNKSPVTRYSAKGACPRL
jgi:hypothetical protein